MFFGTNFLISTKIQNKFNNKFILEKYENLTDYWIINLFKLKKFIVFIKNKNKI